MALAASGQYKEKMLIQLPPGFGQFRLKIIPIPFDSIVRDSSILNCVDTLPSYLFGARTYELMYKDDSMKLAVRADEYGMFRKKTIITQFWKNGNMQRVAVYKRHSKHYLCYNYYANEILASRGKYKNNKKIGRWIYVNTGKRKTRVEHYSSDGKLKSTKNFKPPHGTAATFFMVPHPDGQPYIVRALNAKGK
jgi:hypothetical protein